MAAVRESIRRRRARRARTERRGLATVFSAVLPAVLAAGAALGLNATLAGAQLTDPPDTSNPPKSIFDDLQGVPQENREPVPGVTVPDTDYTPYAKDGSTLFPQLGGALFPRGAEDDPTALVEGSPTTYADNLYDVDFASADLGLAGGATCTTSNPDAESGCVPVVLRFTRSPERGALWERVTLPEPLGEGFVGAIAWITPTVAMAVGGTGTYPRREPPYGRSISGAPCEPPHGDDLHPWAWNCDQAGEARAWRYDAEADHWCELGTEDCGPLPRGRQLPDGSHEPAHGLTAVDFRRYEDGRVLGFVGGLGQIWRWQGTSSGGAFDAVYDNASDSADLKQQPPYWAKLGLKAVGDSPGAGQPRFFRFRVREIELPPTAYPYAYAITSGCCSRYETTDKPVVLTYTEADGPLWWEANWGGNVTVTQIGARDSPDPESVTELPPEADAATEVGSIAHRTGADTRDAESLYSMATATNSAGQSAVSLLFSPASTDSAREGASKILCPNDLSRGRAAFELSGQRLLAVDGSINTGFGCEAFPDRAVGELRGDSAGAHGRRGLVVETKTGARVVAPTSPIGPTAGTGAVGEAAGGKPPSVRPTPEEATAGWEPTSEEQVRRSLTALRYLTTSYTLNSLDQVGSTGAGWAVGDHGAIVRIGVEGAAGVRGVGAEPAPPPLGPRTPAVLSEPGGYRAPPAAQRSGAVPSLASRPPLRLDEPRLVGYGSPDASFARAGSRTEEVAQIAMSRDGTEGWAIGPNPVEDFPTTDLDNVYGVTSFYHFDGSSWTRCDPTGVPGQMPADPACSAVAGLLSYAKDKEMRRVRLVAAARVPLERDGDPHNDEDFEVVAIGSAYRNPQTQPAPDDPVILRLRDGVWRFEPLERRAAVTSPVPTSNTAVPLSEPSKLALKDVAFTAPDDGWILARHNLNNGVANELYRYDGARWHRCRLADPEGVVYRPGDTGLSDCGTASIPAREEDTGTGTATNPKQMRMVAAGPRIYLYGYRARTLKNVGGSGFSTAIAAGQPFILYRERGGSFTDGLDPGGPGGGYDPGLRDPTAEASGTIDSLAVARNGDGSYSGWAVGRFFDLDAAGTNATEPAAVVMRLDPETGRWSRYRDPVLDDYLWPWIGSPDYSASEPHINALLPRAEGEAAALIGQSGTGRLFAFDPASQRWSLVGSDRPPAPALEKKEGVHGNYQAIVPDGAGGAWLAIKNLPEEATPSNLGWIHGGQIFFYHYTTGPPAQVFAEVAHPFGGGAKLTALAGAADGSLWAASDSAAIARYDRAQGWQVARIPGWDPGRIVTAASAANAVAAAADGSGVAVGVDGRIAELTPDSVRLDEAAATLCDGDGLGPGCGTSRDLTAVAVEPEGAALAAGRAMATLWRPGRGQPFGRIAEPPGGASSTVTAISMPSARQAWLALDTGLVVAGELTEVGEWRWRVENQVRSGPDRGLILGSLGPDSNIPLRAIAVDAAGHGYAVGDSGLVLERTADPQQPWRRLRGPGTDHLTSVVLGAGEGGGALIGGKNGVIWTVADGRPEVARPADYFRYFSGYDPDHPQAGPLTGRVLGMALLPGTEDGEVEAWVALGETGPDTDRLLHYTSDPGDPLLAPGGAARPLPDAPGPREGELTFAAFGKSDCASNFFCPPMPGSNDAPEVALARIVAELTDGRGARPEMVLFSGDAAASTGGVGSSKSTLDRRGDKSYATLWVDFGYASYSPRGYGARHHRRFADWVMRPLAAAGIPLLGALGSGDLSRLNYGTLTADTFERTKTGDNLAWREGLVTAPEPWGEGAVTASASGLSIEPAAGSSEGAIDVREQTVDPDLDEDRQPVAEPVRVGGGARTHYAVDLSRAGEAVARVVVVDSSLRSLASADGIAHPAEPAGQLAWLERMLCVEGQVVPGTGSCTRRPGQAAIVLSNTPTYSYASVDPSALATDGAVLESLYLRYGVAAVVSGRLGWNGRYWATAAGVHEPCPGGAYSDVVPEPETRVCGREETGAATDQAKIPGQGSAAATDVAESLRGLGAPAPPDPVGITGDLGATGIVPFVVASGAGGKFGPDGQAQGTASEGFWHGYTIVRIPASGDPRGLIVEQRPVLDWIGLSAPRHVLRPGQRMRLRGVGREPIAFSPETAATVTRYDDIASAAITHRYDLLLADPDEPWRPEVVEGNGNPHGYVPLDPSVARIDSQTGLVTSGRDSRGRVYALALLSVGAKAATWPLVFEPRRSYRPPPAPRLSNPAVPAVRVLGFNASTLNAPTSPPPAAPPPPVNPTIELPVPPPLPSLPVAAAPPITPPVPPAPPPPPASHQGLPIDLTIQPLGITVPPTTGVTAQPTPPVNPSPPSGARREAKQPQASAAKSEEGAGQAKEAGVDLADNPPAPFTRHDRRRAGGGSLTVVGHEQASSWVTGLYWGGGIAAMSLILGFAFMVVRPTPRGRRRPPVVPAPAHGARRRRW